MSNQILLIVDMLSPYDFPGSEALAEHAPAAVERILGCRRAAPESGIPVVFANDIHDQFSGSRESIFRHALEGERPDLVRPLEPAPGECFLHKGQHSAFYGTPLAHLLHQWDADDLILTGQVTEQCILYTALDAHVRHYGITVLTDCVLSIDPGLGEAALRMMEKNMGANLATADDLTGG